MQDIFNIFITLFVCTLAILFLDRRSDKNKKSVADEPFYIPGVLEKKPTKTPLRRVNDITTEMLRDERHICIVLRGVVKSEVIIDYYKAKSHNINIRLSIKQTKP